MNRIRDRYENDMTFRMLVDVIRNWIHQHHTTPSELREAVMLAAYIAEMENPVPTRFRTEGFARDLLRELQRAESGE